MSRPHVLLLAGTAEARGLSHALGGWPIDLTVSLAGITRQPETYAGRVRTGGFGGEAGLSRFLSDTHIAAVIDATHPFAAQMTRRAVGAARANGVPLLRLQRPAWSPRDGERWGRHPSLQAALRAVPAGARAFLATGKGTADGLTFREDVNFFLRSIEPAGDLAPNVIGIRARPPFTVEQEMSTFERYGISHLVTRNSGGPSGREKLEAAASLGIEVLMVERPPLPEGLQSVPTVDAALDWLWQVLDLDTASARTP